MPYFFLKQVLKYFESLKPTAKARSLILILPCSSISLHAAVSRTFCTNAEGVNPVSDFNFSVSTLREVPISLTNSAWSKSASLRRAFTQSIARWRNVSSNEVYSSLPTSKTICFRKSAPLRSCLFRQLIIWA